MPDLLGLADGGLAALWLGALWWTVSLRARGASFADRTRGVLSLGTALPFGLACIGLLNAPCLFLGLVAIFAFRRAHMPRGSTAEANLPQPNGAAWRDGLPALAAIGFAWPVLVRPPESGDTLWYHLPNAAAWAREGTLWLTTTHYWWYPGGSELFAAGLIAVAGPLAAPLAGTGAFLFLGLRVATWLSAEGVPGWVAGAAGAALLAAYPVAVQAANLGNDVWLAALFLEMLWLGRNASSSRAGRRTPQAANSTAARAFGIEALSGTAALLSLVKPDGIAFAIAGLALARARPRVWLAGLLPFCMWVARDAISWHGAWLAPGDTAVADPVGTTILANFGALVPALVTAFERTGIDAFIFFALGLAAIVVARDRRVSIAAAFALFVFIVEPFGFRNDVPQLASGEALRFALPLFAFGAIALAPFARRFAWAVGGVALLLFAFELSRLLSLFWFVTQSRYVLVAIVVEIVALFVLAPRLRPVWNVALALSLCAFSVAYAHDDPVAFYDAWAARGAAPTQIFAWLAAHPPPSIVASGVDAGPFAIVLPSARIADGRRREICGEARALGATILAREPVAAGEDDPERCGATIVRDGAFIVVAPQ